MERALEILTWLQQAKSYDENYPTNLEIQEAIAEINHFIDESESIRMLCDDRGGRIAELEEAMKPKTCDWKQCTSEYDTSWEGTCGVKWLLIDGTPTENHMKFCPQCGGKLIEISSKG